MTVQCEAYVRRSKFCMLKGDSARLITVEFDMT
jgi:hypothetical protein